MLCSLGPHTRRYDPERFAAPREEDKAKPFSFIGFGGGRHGCLGSNFAYLQVLVRGWGGRVCVWGGGRRGASPTLAQTNQSLMAEGDQPAASYACGHVERQQGDMLVLPFSLSSPHLLPHIHAHTCTDLDGLPISCPSRGS